jgi:hypothetical protein
VFYFYFSTFKIEGILIFIFVQICFECTITILNKFSVKKSEPNKEKKNKKQKQKRGKIKKRRMRIFFIKKTAWSNFQWM